MGTIFASQEIAFFYLRRNSMQGKFLTAYWNNMISIAFGIVASVYITVSLIVGVNTGSFIGLVVIIGST